MILKVSLIYLAVISLVSVIVTIHDKSAAIKKRRRVPEKTLILLSLIGGSVAMYVTMQMIRHKTRHAKFMLGIPAIMVLQLGVLIVVGKYFA
jgi:uncharacterized membrane protein YsdA (DUF1294 family)